jgi:hypothetical protein
LLPHIASLLKAYGGSASVQAAPVVSRNVRLSLIPITLGVGIATVYDLELNAMGSGMSNISIHAYTYASIYIYINTHSLPCTYTYTHICAVFASIAVVSTALAQILTSSSQTALRCDALQLLFHTAPIIAVVSE